MGWGLSLHMQLNPKKFFAPSARTIIATLDLDLSPHYVRQEQPARYAHPTAFATLTPPNHTTSLTLGHTLATLATLQQPGYRRRPSHTQTFHVGSQASPPLDSCQAAHAHPRSYLPNTHPTFLVRSTLTPFGAHQFRHALTTFALTAQTQPGVCLTTPSGGIYISLFVWCHSFMLWLVWFFVWVGWVFLCEQPDA